MQATDFTEFTDCPISPGINQSNLWNLWLIFSINGIIIDNSDLIYRFIHDRGGDQILW